MDTSKNINNFLNSICDNIKYYPIRESVRTELCEHLLEEKEQYIKSGLDNENAEIQAINNFGSPEEISTNFNKIYRRQLDWKLLIIYILLISINILLTISIAINKNIDIEYTIRNTSYIIIGIVISFFLFFFNYQKLKTKYVCLRNRKFRATCYNC